MFARPNALHSQIAYVTNDIEAAVRLFQEQFDIPGFLQFVGEGHGPDGSAQKLNMALTRVGGVEIELIEPIGEAMPLFGQLADLGPALVVRHHHVAIRIDGPQENWEAHLASLDRAIHPVVFTGDIGDQMHFVYTDERATVGHYVEHIWLSPEFQARMHTQIPAA